MSGSSDATGFPPSIVCVLDTGALANMKKKELLKIDEQFGMFTAMTQLLRSGHLAYPKQVAAEMSRVDYPDTPGAWAAGCNGLVRYPAPHDEAIAEVLGAAQLMDPQGEHDYEEADPYVVAMAYEISERYPDCRVIVVSDDFKDRMPRKQSIHTACERLGIECWRSGEFVEHMKATMAGD